MKINRRSLLIPWALLIALFVVMIRQSVSYGITRLAIVVIGIVVIAELLYFLWRQTIVRWSTIGGLAYGKELREWPCYSFVEMRSRMFLWLSHSKVSPLDSAAGSGLEKNRSQLLH